MLNFSSYAVDQFFAAASSEVALVRAAHTSTTLAGTHAVTAAELEIAQLKQALASRDVIGQAKGILMGRRAPPLPMRSTCWAGRRSRQTASSHRSPRPWSSPRRTLICTVPAEMASHQVGGPAGLASNPHELSVRQPTLRS